MKKILLITALLFLPLQANAFEDYIVLSDFPIKSVYSKDESIISVVPFYTIGNEKNTLVLKSKSEGQTKLVIETGQSVLSADVNVTEKETIISPIDGISFFVLDMVTSPEKPVLRGAK